MKFVCSLPCSWQSDQHNSSSDFSVFACNTGLLIVSSSHFHYLTIVNLSLLFLSRRLNYYFSRTIFCCSAISRRNLISIGYECGTLHNNIRIFFFFPLKMLETSQYPYLGGRNKSTGYPIRGNVYKSTGEHTSRHKLRLHSQCVTFMEIFFMCALRATFNVVDFSNNHGRD